MSPLNKQTFCFLLITLIILASCRTVPTVTPTSRLILTPSAEPTAITTQTIQAVLSTPETPPLITPIVSAISTRVPATRRPTFTPGPPLPAHDASVAFLVPDATGQDLWIGNLDGSGMWKLQDNVIGFPLWSPDGQWLAFQRGRDAWIIRRDGTEAEIVFAHDLNTGHSYPYAWLPDGTLQIMWAEYNTEEAPYELTDFQYFDRQLPLIQSNNLRTQSLIPMSGFAWTADGSWSARLDPFGSALTLQQHPAGTLFSRPIDVQCGGGVAGLFWSPDGQWLAHWRSGNGRYGTMRICLSQPFGADFPIPMAQTSKPVWGVDSQSVYFFNHYTDPDETGRLREPQIFRYDLETEALTSLHAFPETVPISLDLALSPDGQWLAVLLPEWREENLLQYFFVLQVESGEWHQWPVPGEVRVGSFGPQFTWSNDNRSLMFPASDDYFYALNILDGTTRQLLGPTASGYWVVSPVAMLP